MRIALYTENPGENLRFAEVVPYVRQEDFCRMVRAGPEDFELFVVAQDGAFGLEVAELLREIRLKAQLARRREEPINAW